MEVKHLLVKIGADKQDYEGAMGGVSKSIEGHKEQFRKAGMAMTVAGAAIVGTIGMMVKSYVSAGDEVHKMALRTGFSTEALSELKYAAQIGGTSLEGLEKGIRKMQDSIVKGSEGLSTYTKAFDRIGISVKDLQGLSPEQQFDKITKAIAAVEDPTIRAATAGEIFGSRIGTQLLPMLADGAEAFEKTKQKAHELGIVFDQEAANKAARLQDAMTMLKGSFQGVFFAVADTLVPVLSNLAEKISGTISKIKDWIDAHPALAGMITKVALGIGALLTVLGPLVMMLPALAGGFTLLMGPIGIVIAAVAGLTAAGILVVANWGKIKTFLANIWDSIKQVAVNIFNSIKQFFIDSLMWILDKVSKIPIAGKFAKGWKESLDSIKAEMTSTKTVVTERGMQMAKALTDVVGKSDLLKKAAGFLKDKVGILGNIFKATKKDTDSLGWSFAEAKEKAKTWIDYLKDVGIMTIKEKGEKVKELEGFLRDIEQAYRDGKIEIEDYTEAKKKLKAEIEAITIKMTETAIPATRNFGDVLLIASGNMDTTAFATLTAKDQLVAFANQMGTTTGHIQEYFYNLAKFMMDLSGIHIPNVTFAWNAAWPQIVDGAENVRSKWDEMTDGIKTKWAEGLKGALFESKSWGDAVNGVWDHVKNQFKDTVASMLSKWTFGFIEGVLSGGKDLFSGIKGIFGSIGEAATGAASGAGTGGLFGGLSGSFLSSIAKMAGPIGIGLLVAKFVDLKKIGEAVTDAICTAFEALGGIIKGVGQVFSAVFGTTANIITGIGNVVSGLSSAIGNLFGLAGKAKDEGGYWLSLIRAINQDILNATQHIANKVDKMFGPLHSITQATQKLMAMADGRFTNLLQLIRDWTKNIAQRMPAGGEYRKILDEISYNTWQTFQAIKNIVSGQGGVDEYISRAKLYVAHPGERVKIGTPAAFTGGTKDMRQSSFKMNVYGPLVTSVGISNADLEYAGDKLMRIIERKLAAKGRSL